MTVCSEMLELILGPINLVNSPKSDDDGKLETGETIDMKEDESNSPAVAVACCAMNSSITAIEEDFKDSEGVASTNSDTTIFETSNKGTYLTFRLYIKKLYLINLLIFFFFFAENDCVVRFCH